MADLSDPHRDRVKRRRPLALLVWAVVGVVLICVALVVADISARSWAQARIASEIESQLPEGVAGDVTVEIGGTSVIAQYLAGRFDEVELDAPRLTIDGAPVSAHVTAKGVPTDFDKPIDSVVARATLNDEAINRLVKLPSVADIVLGDGTVSFIGSNRVLGVAVSYQATAQLTTDGSRLLATPESIDVTAGPVGVDLTGAAQRILGDEPLSVCIASELPEGVTLSGVSVSSRAATFELSADGFVPSEKSFDSRGDCR